MRRFETVERQTVQTFSLGSLLSDASAVVTTVAGLGLQTVDFTPDVIISSLVTLDILKTVITDGIYLCFTVSTLVSTSVITVQIILIVFK